MLSLVKFYSKTCAPCKTMEPIVAQVVDSSEDVIVSNVDIADNPGLVQEHFVRAVPTFILFKEGIEISRRAGSCTLGEFTGWIDEFRNIQPEVLSNPSSGVPGASTIVLHNTSEQGDAGTGSD